MSIARTPITLFNVARGQPEEAELVSAITEQQLADWEALWVPELFGALKRLHQQGVARPAWPQSRHWDWRRKAEALQGMLAHPAFSIICDGVTQAMMIVDVTTKRCRVDSQRGKDLVYIWFVENAPWNRAELLYDPPRYRGCGTVLVRAAIELSKSEDFKGRIGLHSLPQSNSFYANTCGMTDLGADPDVQGLRYFESTPEQADAFINRGKP